jgi:hypothetical protein
VRRVVDGTTKRSRRFGGQDEKSNVAGAPVERPICPVAIKQHSSGAGHADNAEEVMAPDELL